MALGITDTTFRDGHQSLMATRLRTGDMTPIAKDMDSVGFHSMEVWGGATFDTAIRFLGEDPWDRLRKFKELIPGTPLQMLLRGQSLVGYRNYADDVVDEFVNRSADVGIDIFRVFDALNDERNLQRAATAVMKSGKHLQMTICYSVTEEGRMGGDIYNISYYVERAKAFESMGADSICIKDMAGILAPYDAFELVSALKNVLHIPIQLHTHYTSGMASMTVLKAIEAGVDVVDTCLAPLAMRTAQPAIEPLLISLKGGDKDPGLDMDKILRLGDYMESVLPKYKSLLETPKTAVIDAKVLSHQIPGGMTSNLVSQLREVEALDRLPEVFEEIPLIRKDLGYPPLVTPMSQMIGSQSVSNVLFGRYKMVSKQIKDYVYGMYGQPPAPIDEHFTKEILAGYEKGETPTTERPGDLITPELEQAKETIEDISKDIDDVLTYALYPTPGLSFLRIKHGIDPMPEDMKEPPDVVPSSDISGKPATSSMPSKSYRVKAFNVYVENEYYMVEVDPLTSATEIRTSNTTSYSSKDQSPPTIDPGDQKITSPMPGILIRNEVEVGQRVTAGDTVVVLESMKMETSIPSLHNGIVQHIGYEPGAKVSKGDVLAIIIT